MITAIPPDLLSKIKDKRPQDIRWTDFEEAEYAVQDYDAYALQNNEGGFTVVRAYVDPRPASDQKTFADARIDPNGLAIFTVLSSPEIPAAGFYQHPASSALSMPALRMSLPTKNLVNDNTPNGWFHEALLNERSHRRDKALDIIFLEVDMMLRQGEFERCNEFLMRVNIEELPITLMVSLLMITLAANEKLPARKTLFDRVREKLQTQPGKLTLLQGLEGFTPINRANPS
jgi:hypothetical protein